MSDIASVSTKTFTADLIRAGSWGEQHIGVGTSTMGLYDYTDDKTRGFIEWDLPAIDDCESIGLWYELNNAGVRTLTDYDGVMSLPAQAVDMLEAAGIVVSDEFKE